MTKLKRSRGRPQQDSENSREALILAARTCFASKPFREVTTRMVAEKAGVNAALIRYYFMNKDGLYQQTLAHVAAEFQKTVEGFVADNPERPFEAVLRGHAAIVKRTPDIPKLIFKELAFNEGKARQVVLDNVARPNRQFIMKLFAEAPDTSQLRDDFDPSLFLMSAMSLSVVPHLLRESFEQMEGRKMDDEMIEKMIWQNAQMMQFGGFKKRQQHND